jgi:hypothetical protein
MVNRQLNNTLEKPGQSPGSRKSQALKMKMLLMAISVNSDKLLN